MEGYFRDGGISAKPVSTVAPMFHVGAINSGTLCNASPPQAVTLEPKFGQAICRAPPSYCGDRINDNRNNDNDSCSNNKNTSNKGTENNSVLSDDNGGNN